MTLPTITKTTRPLRHRKFFIYYDTHDGEIVHVSSARVIDSILPYVITDSRFAADILCNKRNRHEFTIGYNSDFELALMEKTANVLLRSLTDAVYLIPHGRVDSWDIRVKLYSVDNQMVFELNPASVARLTLHQFKNDVTLDKSSELTMFITSRNEHNRLYDIVTLDPNQMMEFGKYVYDMTAIARVTSLADIIVMTPRVMKNYYFEIVNAAYIEPSHDIQNNKKINRIAAVKTNDTHHIEIIQTGTSLCIQSSVPGSELNDIGFIGPVYKIFIVDSDPSEILTVINIDTKKLQKNRSYTIRNFKYDIDQVNLLHDNPNLIISKRKICDN